MTDPDATRSALAAEIVAAGREMYAAGLIAGGAGNLSARWTPEAFLITPRGWHKGKLSEDLIAEVSLNAPPGGAPEASSETPFHRETYRARPDVGAVIHAHPPALIAVGLRALDLRTMLPEVELAIGRVAALDFIESGTEALGRAVGAAAAAGASVILLRNHGAISLGEDLGQAAARMELAELSAYAALLATDGASAVDDGRIDRLLSTITAARDTRPSRR